MTPARRNLPLGNMETHVSIPNLEVITAAIATPYTQQGEIDRGLLASLVERYVERGIEGIYCCGSSGEGLLLDLDERTTVVATAVEAAAGRVPVVAHVGALSTRGSTELAVRAEAAGAVAVSMIPPIYYSYSTDEVVAHYKAVMDAVQVPMIIYNIPQFTGTELTADSARALLSDDRVIGVKQTAHNMYSLERMRAQFPHKAFINGFDEVFLSALAAGARGTIGTTVGIQFELFAAVRDLFEQGRIGAAQTVQSMINTVVAEIVTIGVFPAAKYLSGRGVGDLGPARSPFHPLERAERARLDELGERVDDFVAQVRALVART